MKRRSDTPDNWEALREKIIGLGEQSIQKSYYPQLQRKLEEAELVRSLLDHSIDSIFLARVPEGTLIDVNMSACERLGFSREEMLGMPLMDLLSPPEAHQTGAFLSGPDPAGKNIQINASLLRRTGEALPVEMNLSLVELKGLVHAVAVMRDISERLQGDEALRQSERIHRLLIDNTTDMITRHSPDDRITYVTPACECLLGFSPEEMLGHPAGDFLPPEDHDLLWGPIRASLKARQGHYQAEFRMLRRDGSTVWVEARGKIIYDEQGCVAEIHSAVRDISARKAAEEALAESEERYRSLFENAIEGIFQTTLDGRLLMLNNALVDMLGYASPQEARERVTDIGAQVYADPQVRASLIARLRREGQVTGSEILFKRADGSLIKVMLNFRLARDRDGNPAWIEGSCIDITDRWRAEEALTQSEALLRSTFNATADGVLLVDRQGKITQMNRQFREMWRIPEGLQDTRDDEQVRGFVLDQLQDPAGFITKIHELYRSSREDLDEIRFKDGRVFERYTCPMLLEGEEIGRVWDFRDITERKQAEERIRQANRQLEAIIEFLPDATLIVNAKGTIIAWNRALEEMSGIDKHVILGKDHSQGGVPFYRDIRPSLVDLLDKSDAELEASYAFVKRKGETLYAEAYAPALYNGKGAHIWAIATPLYDSDGHVIGAIETIRDITERKQAEEELQAWMHRYELIVEASGQVAYEYLVPTGDITWGRSFEKVLGYPQEEICGGFLQWQDLLHPEDREATLERLAAAEKACAFWDARYRLRHRLGHYVWIRDRGFFLPGPDGRAYNQLGMLEDITERKQAEEELKKSEEKYRAIFEEALEGIFQIRPEGGFLTANPALARILGFDSPEGLLRETSETITPIFVHPADHARLFDRLKEQERIEGYEVELVRQDGRRIWVSVNARTVRDSHGFLLYFEGTCVDITASREAEAALRESEQHLADIIAFLPDATLVIDRQGRVTAWNKAMEDLTKIPAREMLGQGDFAYAIPLYGERRPMLIDLAIHPDKEIERRYYRLTRRGSLIIGETDVPVVRGEKRFLSGWAQPIFDSSGATIGAIECVRDITDRQEAEEALAGSEARYRLLAENASDIIFTMDLDLRFTYISPSVERIRGYRVEEVLRQGLEEVLTPGSREAALKAFEEARWDASRGQIGERWMRRTLELEERCKDGSTIWTETTFTPLSDTQGHLTGFLGITRDITERRRVAEERTRLEVQLVQAQKMESIGTLAGGIAHDFNNILSAIIGYTGLALEDLPEMEKVQRELREVLKAGDRAKDLVAQILTFSRKTDITYAPLALKSVIKESLKLLRSVIPTTIEIRQDISASGLVFSDVTQINQVVMNLCTNAAHAMGRAGGLLEVSLKRVVLDQEAADRLAVAPGPYLRLTVADTGQGMPPEVLERIFEPYFTTKEQGRGTGLGLSVVHGIVKNHRGAVTCRSTPGEGTAFEVYLPEIVSELQDEAASTSEPYPTGTERILFIDDEQTLAELAERMLSSLGYSVTVRTSSVEALASFREDPEAFDLVITDMTMPGITGDMLAQQIMKIRPETPVILCTGYSEHITEERARDLGIREFMLKPIEMGRLATSIRKVLKA